VSDKTSIPFIVAGNGVGRDGALRNSGEVPAHQTMIVSGDRQVDGTNIVTRRHSDFLEHQIRWRWLLDSYEGGDRYRNAVYGPDRKGLPTRNLFRHRREYPDPQQFPVVYGGFAGGLDAVSGAPDSVGFGPYPGMLGADPSATAQDDDYELRRARTPVPEFVAESVELHLSKVYGQEVTRKGPEDLTAWWKDVDGQGTSIDDWMRETVAPLLLVLGCLDICLDHPEAPPGEKIETRADELRLGLDKCIASYILPQNMVWWKCDRAGRYVECLVREYVDPSERVDTEKDGRLIDPDGAGKIGEAWRKNYVRYRHWKADESVLYNSTGDEVLQRLPHSFGRVPIVRLIDQKKHRTPTIGKSRYEAVAELQREYYNRDSELILSDTLQAHPLLSGPEDYCKADNTLSIGPGYVLPKKKSPETGSYEGWEYTSPPKDPAESLRKNKQDLIDLKDRRTCQLKPAGAHGHGGGHGGGSVVAQSGISKQLDAAAGHKLLGSIAKSLAKAERFIAEFAILVLRNRVITPPERDGIKVIYSDRFELFSASELTDVLTRMQASMDNCGASPRVEARAYQSIVRQILVGLSDEDYAQMDQDIDSLVEMKSRERGVTRAYRPGPPIGVTDNSEALEGAGSAELAAGVDPSGQSGGTLIANMIPAVQ
jgi:hypothetical protein